MSAAIALVRHRSFRLFTWFFVIPGVLLVLLAGIPLVEERRASRVVVSPLEEAEPKAVAHA